MSTFYRDQLTAIIHNHLAPDVMTALQSCDTLELMRPRNSITVPLQAGVDVAYDQGMGAFILNAIVCDKDKNKWLGGRSVFSTREIETAHDKAAIIEYLFDEAKKQFLFALAKGELAAFIKSKKP